MEDAHVCSSSSGREVKYETRLPDLAEKPNQPTAFNFPK